jgi:hypothetical protein
MATETPVANSKQTKAGRPRAATPPAGTFWKKYSPHHEFPLSLSSSLFLHILGFAVLGGLIFAILGLSQDRELPVDAVRIDHGGGGNQEGIGNKNPGSGVLPSNEAKDQAQPDDLLASTVAKEPLKKPEETKPEITLPKTTSPRQIEAASAATDSKLSAAGSKARKLLSGALAGKGQGGSGSGGGQGSGNGTGIGNASGPGRGNLTQREKRQLRWTMIFNTRSGEDYADQLRGLGAILAIPGPNGDYLVIRDLDRRHRPVQAVPEDLNKLNRIYWVDDKPQSVNSLARALGIRPIPDRIVAFFPQQLEQELAEKEKKAFHGNEEDIGETVFKVERWGNGYVPMVQMVRRK